MDPRRHVGERFYRRGCEPALLRGQLRGDPRRVPARKWRTDMTFTFPQVVRHKETGDLLIAKERYAATKTREAGFTCSPIDNRYSSRSYPVDEIEPAPPRKPAPKPHRRMTIPRCKKPLMISTAPASPVTCALPPISKKRPRRRISEHDPPPPPRLRAGAGQPHADCVCRGRSAQESHRRAGPTG